MSHWCVQTYFGYSEAERAAIDSYQEWLFGMVRTGPFRVPGTLADWLAFGPDPATTAALSSLPGLHTPFALTKAVRYTLAGHVSCTRLSATFADERLGPRGAYSTVSRASVCVGVRVCVCSLSRL